jgi:hypothetical protein
MRGTSPPAIVTSEGLTNLHGHCIISERPSASWGGSETVRPLLPKRGCEVDLGPVRFTGNGGLELFPLGM